MRFVAVGTMLRGALEVPEPLDEQGQVLANYRMELDQAQDQAGLRMARVVWHQPRRDAMSVEAGNLVRTRRMARA